MDDCKHEEQSHHSAEKSVWLLAAHCTLLCLLGCGLGEIVGFTIATSFGWPPFPKIAFSVSLGYVFGFYLGTRPLIKKGMPFLQAAKIIGLAEFISITVMETAEVLVEVYTPGVMMAGLTEPIFWMGMGLALTAGYAVAYPVNYFLIKKNIRNVCH
jgi:hypothetical protein